MAEYTIDSVLETLEDQKDKLEEKLDKTVSKIHSELEQLEYLINIVKEYQISKASTLLDKISTTLNLTKTEKEETHKLAHKIIEDI